MRITLRASGTLKSGPERDLTDDYLRRAARLARDTGFLGVEEVECATKPKASRTLATEQLLSGIPDGASLVVLDERGTSPTSREIARHFGRLRDEGCSDLVLLIGPADGFDPDLLPRAPMWRFGAQTWPHKLLRAMAAEQIYRALSILAGTPYHRD